MNGNFSSVGWVPFNRECLFPYSRPCGPSLVVLAKFFGREYALKEKPDAI